MRRNGGKFNRPQTAQPSFSFSRSRACQIPARFGRTGARRPAPIENVARRLDAHHLHHPRLTLRERANLEISPGLKVPVHAAGKLRRERPVKMIAKDALRTYPPDSERWRAIPGRKAPVDGEASANDVRVCPASLPLWRQLPAESRNLEVSRQSLRRADKVSGVEAPVGDAIRPWMVVKGGGTRGEKNATIGGKSLWLDRRTALTPMENVPGVHQLYAATAKGNDRNVHIRKSSWPPSESSRSLLPSGEKSAMSNSRFSG